MMTPRRPGPPRRVREHHAPVGALRLSHPGSEGYSGCIQVLGGAGGVGGMVRGGGVSESATKALRVGVGGERRRGISTFLLARSGSIGVFVADLDNPPGADRPGRASVGRSAAGEGASASEQGPRAAAVTPFWSICGDPARRTRRPLRSFTLCRAPFSRTVEGEGA